MGKHEHRDGLDYHLRVLRDGSLKRRDVMRWAVGAGLVTLVGCGDDDGDGDAAGSGGGSAGKGGSGGSSDCSKIPEETAGPYPADGSNGANGGPPGMGGQTTTAGDTINALTMSGIMRRDIRSSFGSSSTTAEGVPLSIKLRVRNTRECEPIEGAAVYLWHCDRAGKYSLYSTDLQSENYLRGVQVTDDDGYVTFESIFQPATAGAGRISTSKSIRASRRRLCTRTSSPTRSSRCRKKCVMSSSPKTATRPASTT